MTYSFLFALAAAGPPAAAQPQSGVQPSAVAGLTAQLSSTNVITRSRAALALGSLGEGAHLAIPHLAQALSDADPFVARDAAEALGAIGKSAVPALRTALRSADMRVRMRALLAFSRCRADDRATVVALAHVLHQDDEPEVRRWAALALERIGLTGRGLIANLTAALSDKDRSVRISAAVALGSYGAEAQEAAGCLGVLMLDQSAGVRTAATEALRRIAGPIPPAN